MKNGKHALRDEPPTLPGAEWRPADSGGWNLWDFLGADGSGKRWCFAGHLAPEEWAEIKTNAEVKNEDQDSVRGDDLGDQDLAAPGQADDVAPTGGQATEITERPPVGKEPKKPKPRPKKNVLSFKLPAGGQTKAKGGRRKTSARAPTGGQDDQTEWLKSLLPIEQTGSWWETPADDKGFKIKLRWRVGSRKGSYVFRRLGKRDIQTLKEKPYERQVWLISDRIFGELHSEGRADVSAWLRARPRLDRVAGAEN